MIAMIAVIVAPGTSCSLQHNTRHMSLSPLSSLPNEGSSQTTETLLSSSSLYIVLSGEILSWCPVWSLLVPALSLVYSLVVFLDRMCLSVGSCSGPALCGDRWRAGTVGSVVTRPWPCSHTDLAMKVLKKIKARIGLSHKQSAYCPPAQPLEFHPVHGDNVMLSANNTIAAR